jgi:transcriptional regulator with XRE-family HTH domain
MSKPKPGVLYETGFSERLKAARRSKNLTQIELAKLTDVSYVHIGRLEKGTSQPTADIILRLATGLGVTAGFLLDGTHQTIAACLEDAEFARQFQLAESLPPGEKAILKSLVEAFLFRHQVQQLGRAAS